MIEFDKRTDEKVKSLIRNSKHSSGSRAESLVSPEQGLFPLNEYTLPRRATVNETADKGIQ